MDYKTTMQRMILRNNVGQSVTLFENLFNQNPSKETFDDIVKMREEYFKLKLETLHDYGLRITLLEVLDGLKPNEKVFLYSDDYNALVTYRSSKNTIVLKVIDIITEPDEL